VSKGGSIFSLWVQDPSFSNSAGTVNFEGVVLNPGYAGSMGKLLSITFRTKAVGAANLSLSSGQVLANDGAGTNILKGSGKASFIIGGQASTAPTTPALPQPQITSITNPDQNNWYTDVNPKFSWSLPANINAVRLLYDKNNDTVPAVTYAPAIADKELTSIADGVWYFHARFKKGDTWGPISTFRFQIDTQPPLPFSLFFSEGDNITTATPSLILNATDTLSGIDHYQIKIDGEEPLNVASKDLLASSTYILPSQISGQHYLEVAAYDQAGNYSSATKVFRVSLPEKLPVVSALTKPISAVQFSWLAFGEQAINYLLIITIVIFLVIIILIISLYGTLKIKRLLRELKRESNSSVDHELLHALKLLNDNLELELKTLDKLSDRLRSASDDPLINKGMSQFLSNSQKLALKTKNILGRKK
jgi:hypothetical protein